MTEENSLEPIFTIDLSNFDNLPKWLKKELSNMVASELLKISKEQEELK